MVKIMLQIAITLFLDDADVEFVSWCESIYVLAFKTNAQIFENFNINVVFVADLNR